MLFSRRLLSAGAACSRPRLAVSARFSRPQILLPRAPSTFSHTAGRLFSSAPRRPYQIDPNDPRLRQARPLVTLPRLCRVVRSPSTHAVVLLAAAAAAAFHFMHIEVVPVSGRQRFNCFGASSVRDVADMQFRRVVYEVEHSGDRFLPEHDLRVRMVRRVMERLIPVSGMEDEEWEVRVIDDPGTLSSW